MVKKILAGIIFSVAAIVTILSLGAFVPGIWMCDLFSQFKLVYLILFVACAALLVLLKSKWSFTLCLIGLLINFSSIYAAWSKPVCRNGNQKTSSLSVLNFNTEFQHNNSYELFEQVISSRDPDLIALVEVDQAWIAGISNSVKIYPYRKVVMKGAGMAIFSKYPLLDTKIEYFGASHHPRISSTLRLGDRSIYLMIVHPTTPVSERSYQERDRELALVADELKAVRGAHLLIGDFNCGPWAFAFQQLLRSGMRDSEQGFGYQPSWPARTGRIVDNMPVPPLIPIDHVLVSEDVCVFQRQAGPSINSDHLPVFVRMKFDDAK